MILAFFLLLHFSSQAAIYGVDKRVDIHQTPELRSTAASIAVTVPNIFIKDHDLAHFRVEEIATLATSSGTNVCSTERFSGQPVFDVGTCTGFLVGDRYLVTAGHCILPNGIVEDNRKHPFCDSFRWYFDFNTAAGAQTTEQIIKKKSVYRCVRVVRAENVELEGKPGANPGNDFAILELDRPVEGAKPLVLRTSDVGLREKVFTVGHPLGLPAKFSGIASVHTNNLATQFNANLDTFAGNSGSPVFDNSKNVVGVLVGGHPVDMVFDHRISCNKMNRCDESGTKCSENSTFPWLPTSSQIQRLAPLLKYIPTSYP